MSSNNTILELYSRILRYRSIRPKNIGVTIVDPTQVATTKQDKHLGQYLGYFWNDEDDTCFIIYARSNPFGNASFAYLVTVNRSCGLTINFKREVSRFLGVNAGTVPQLCYINIRHSHNRNYDLAAYMEALPRIMGPGLKRNSKPERQLNLRPMESKCSGSEIPSPCLGVDYLTTSFSTMAKGGVIVQEWSGDWHLNSPVNWQISMIKSSDHRYYLINNPSTKDVVVLLPHNFQLDESEESKIRSFICKVRESSIARLSITRLSPQDSSCVDSHCVGGLLLSLALLPSGLFYIKPEDIKVLSTRADPYVKLHHLEPRSTITLSQQLASLCSSQVSEQNSPGSSQRTIIASQVSTQGSEVMGASGRYSPSLLIEYDPILSQSNEEMRAGEAEIRAGLAQEDDIPRVKTMALHDPDGMALDNIDVFRRCLPLILNEWEKYASVKFLPQCSMNNWEAGRIRMSLTGSGYEICPIVDDTTNVILIFDVEKHEWYYLNSSCDQNQVERQYEKVVESLKKHYPRVASSNSYNVSTTNHFHQKYPRIHLLMMVWTIGRLFRYARVIPRKTIYQERSFRLYCWAICTDIQLNNLRYNMNNGLIDSEGELLAGAYVSYASPVQYERAIVASDTCMICGARGFNNFARHVVMKHSSQARDMANKRYGK